MRLEFATTRRTATSSLLPADRMSAHRLLNLRFHALAIILLMGIFLRLPPALFLKPAGPLRGLVALHPQPASQQLGFDEVLYRDYADKLTRFGLISYPEIIERYREKQQTLTGSIVPPVRFLYIFFAYLWHQFFGSEMLSCLKNVSAVFSMLTLLLAAIFAARLGGSGYAIGVGALMAFAPTQLHMSQHALVDGFFTFWATLKGVLVALLTGFSLTATTRWWSAVVTGTLYGFAFSQVIYLAKGGPKSGDAPYVIPSGIITGGFIGLFIIIWTIKKI